VDKTAIGKEVVSLGIAPVPEGRQRTRFLAVADIENKMRIYSLNPTVLCCPFAVLHFGPFPYVH